MASTHADSFGFTWSGFRSLPLLQYRGGQWKVIGAHGSEKLHLETLDNPQNTLC